MSRRRNRRPQSSLWRREPPNKEDDNIPATTSPVVVTPDEASVENGPKKEPTLPKELARVALTEPLNCKNDHKNNNNTPLSLHLKAVDDAPLEDCGSIGFEASPTSLSLPIGSPRSTVSYDRSSAPLVDTTYETSSAENSVPQPADLLLVSASVGVGAALVGEATVGAADEEDRGWRSRGLSSDLSSTGALEDDLINKKVVVIPELLKIDQNMFVLNFKFNQDGTCFVASTTQGFRVYTSRPLSEFARREVAKEEPPDPPASEISTTCPGDIKNEETDEPSDGLISIFPSRCKNYAIKLVAMLYRSHSFALVTAAEPQKVLLWNDRERRAIGWIRCRYPVLDIAMRREVIAVVTAHAVYVYLSGTVSPLHVIPTGHNPNGIVALSTAPDTPWVLCCPALTPGGVRVQQGVAPDQPATATIPVGPLVFQAHQSQVALLSLNYKGTMVASASTQGTVIRISATVDGTPLREFRLGVIPHAVSCIAFRRDDAFIAVASNSETIHIFKMEEGQVVVDSSQQQRTNNSSRVWSNIGAAVLGQGREVLRSVFPRYFTPARAFATLALQPEADVRACGRHALLLHIRSTQCETCLSQHHKKKLFSAPQQYDTSNTVIGGLKRASCTVVNNLTAVGVDNNRRRSNCEFQSTVAASCTSSGPQVTFTGESSNHLFIVHHDGFVYEARFDAVVGGRCRLLSMAPWFAPRTDFSILGSCGDERLLTADDDDGCVIGGPDAATLFRSSNNNIKEDSSSSSSCDKLSSSQLQQ